MAYVQLSEAAKARYAQLLFERMLRLPPLASLPPVTRKIEAQRRAAMAVTHKSVRGHAAT